MESDDGYSDFAAMLAVSGMQLPHEQMASLFEGYRHMQRLLDLLGRPVALEAEPAVTFTPVQR